MRRVIGISLILLCFGSLFAACAYTMGLLFACIVWGLAILFTAIVSLGAWLAVG